MSPSTVDSTSVSFTPRAAAMLPMPAVMQAAIAWSRNSTGVGALSAPTSTFGWSASNWTSPVWRVLAAGAAERLDPAAAVACPGHWG
jgi:hypothetical protein